MRSPISGAGEAAASISSSLICSGLAEARGAANSGSVSDAVGDETPVELIEATLQCASETCPAHRWAGQPHPSARRRRLPPRLHSCPNRRIPCGNTDFAGSVKLPAGCPSASPSSPDQASHQPHHPFGIGSAGLSVGGGTVASVAVTARAGGALVAELLHERGR